jgi:hypothetical protein
MERVFLIEPTPTELATEVSFLETDAMVAFFDKLGKQMLQWGFGGEHLRSEQPAMGGIPEAHQQLEEVFRCASADGKAAMRSIGLASDEVTK